MLYYSGFTRRIGNVDEGSTVTDFLPAERARGITIQSASISFQWPPLAAAQDLHLPSVYDINLIDTPGHADFTFEVIRSLRVLDGAICILDGVAGVEAQTEKVWAQANNYMIPRIIYVNKLDRDGAAFARTVREIGTRLHCWPAVCMIPWWRPTDRKLQGLGDVVGLRALRWKEGTDGRDINAFMLQELDHEDNTFAQELRKARVSLIELLSDHDGEMVEKYLEYDENHLTIPASDVLTSLRRCVLQAPQTLVPVFAGASFRNLGVQPLLDAVNHFLPSPAERPAPEISLGGQSGTLNDLFNGKLFSTTKSVSRKAVAKSPRTIASPQQLQGCALAFKVVNDTKRGVLVYVRVYSGSISRGVPLFNTNLGVTERASRLLRMYASDAAEIPSIDAGQIGVIVGLKHTRTGDTLVTYANMNAKSGPPAPIDTLQLRPITVPPPVFFTSVEPNSLTEEKHVMESLQILLREDPSLNVSTDPETGQTHLAGMGELHLEIARDRLIQDFKANARIGKIEIGFREAMISSAGPCDATVDREIAGKLARASSTASVSPADQERLELSDTSKTIKLPDNNYLTISHPDLDSEGRPLDPDAAPLPSHLRFASILAALETGATAALARGPTYSYPLHSTHIALTLTPSQVTAETSSAALAAAARQAAQTALKQASTGMAGSALMEPVMLATISVNESHLGAVTHDLSSARGAHIVSLDSESDDDAAPDKGIQARRGIDVRRIYAPPDPFGASLASAGDGGGREDRVRLITARVPLREMVGYLTKLRALTGGRGTFVMQVEGFERVVGSRLKAVLGAMGRV